MASDTLITISEVTDGIMFKSKLPDGEEIRVKQLVLDGIRELNMVVAKRGRKQSLLEMDANYVLDMPDDLESLIDIFVPIDGMVWSLTRNIKIPMILSGGAIPEGWGDNTNVYLNDGMYYASKGGTNSEGYYIEDWANRRFIFRNTSRTEVLLDYTTSGINDSGTTYVQASVKGALESYVLLQLSLYGILPANKYTLFEREYEKQKGILRMKDFNFTAFSDSVYKTITSSYRR